MRYQLSTCLVMIMLAMGVYAQDDPCQLTNTDNYFVHKVQDGETLFGLSDQYGIELQRLKQINRIPPDSNTIAIGELLIVPVHALPQTGEQGNIPPDTTGDKSIHTVKQGQTLFSIAGKYPNVAVDSIKKWNGLSSDTLNLGQKLIIYSAQKEPSDGDDQGSMKQAEKNVQNNRAQTNEGAQQDSSYLFRGDGKEKTKMAGDTMARMNNELDTASASLPFKDFKDIYKDYQKKGYTKQAERGVANWLDENYTDSRSNYYALHKYAPVGSIVEVRNLMNNRKAYVKVIGRLADTDKNRNVLVKVTEATADYLNVLDEKFLVEVTTYAKPRTSSNQ